MTQARRYFGKYRGTVMGNVDDDSQGRLEVNVTSIHAEGDAVWALPCVPYAAPNKGMLLIPPVGAHVWVEFEGGNPDSPIWTGCYWSPGEAPTNEEARKVLITDALTVEINDGEEPQITITIAETTISCNGDSITIDAGGGDVLIKGNKLDVLDGAAEVS